MKKNLTEIVFILDCSGSMNGLEGDTIGGFNSMIEKQKKEKGEALVSTVLFSSRSEVLHDRVPVQDVPRMTKADYVACGCTALLDAIGGAIHHIGNVHKYARPEDVPEHTLFVITTDGLENASRHYDIDRVKSMIERRKKKYGWEFMFLGANIDAVETAGWIGIDADRAVNYRCDGIGTALNFEVLSDAISDVRAPPPATGGLFSGAICSPPSAKACGFVPGSKIFTEIPRRRLPPAAFSAARFAPRSSQSLAAPSRGAKSSHRFRAAACLRRPFKLDSYNFFLKLY